MPSNKIYLCNLPPSVTEALLKEHFTEYGEITEVQLLVDRKTKAPKGYGFITFTAESSAEKALQQDGKSFLENEITVQMAIEKRSKK
ncbi:MAG: RNA-binding protein [Gammaproteobacteria bacterium]|nr:RNA-binding protein [Gammaproteobacteria bacterium]